MGMGLHQELSGRGSHKGGTARSCISQAVNGPCLVSSGSCLTQISRDLPWRDYDPPIWMMVIGQGALCHYLKWPQPMTMVSTNTGRSDRFPHHISGRLEDRHWEHSRCVSECARVCLCVCVCMCVHKWVSGLHICACVCMRAYMYSTYMHCTGECDMWVDHLPEDSRGRGASCREHSILLVC